MKVSHEFYIGYRDTNPKKELTNTALLSCLENMGGIHSAIAKDSINENHTWILLGWKVKLTQRPNFGDTILVETWSREIEKYFIYRDFKVYNADGDIICIATSKWIYIDLNSGKIIKLPEEVQKAYEPELEYSFGKENSKFSKLLEPKEKISMVEFKITKNMIDTNHHLHNIYYMDIVREALPEDIEYNNFEIMYKKEIKLHETVKAFYSYENNQHIVTIKNSEESEVHAIIKMN